MTSKNAFSDLSHHARVLTPTSGQLPPTLGEVDAVRLLSTHPVLLRALGSEDWDVLGAAVARLPMVHQTRGDIADHRLEVGMVVSNNPRPSLACSEGRELVKLLQRPRMRALYQELAGHQRPLHLRRVQANRMREGNYNRAHCDRDDDPDYTMAVLFYFTDPCRFAGGELVFPDSGDRLRPGRHDVVFMRADVLHELTPVTRAVEPRLCLVVLMGEHDGPNRRFAALA
ncbi:MAG: 2OG-Fe(II) oxygenase [Enhygromyxa sp.]